MYTVDMIMLETVFDTAGTGKAEPGLKLIAVLEFENSPNCQFQPNKCQTPSWVLAFIRV